MRKNSLLGKHLQMCSANISWPRQEALAGFDSARYDHTTVPSTGKCAGKNQAPFSQKAELLKEVSAQTVLTQAHQYQTQEQSCPCVFQIKELWVVPSLGRKEKNNPPTNNQAEHTDRVTHLLLEMGLLLLHQLTHPLRFHSFLQQLRKSKSSYLAATGEGSQRAPARLALGLEMGAGWEKHEEQSRAPALLLKPLGERSLLGTPEAWGGLTWSGLHAQGSNGNKPPQRDKAKSEVPATIRESLQDLQSPSPAGVSPLPPSAFPAPAGAWRPPAAAAGPCV